MSADALRLGVLGLGKAGMRHVEAAMASDAVELVAVADTSEKARSGLGRKPPYRVLETETELLKSGIEAVVVALPHAFLAESTIRCLHAGLHVLAEKPLAVSVEAGERVVAAAEMTGHCLMVNYNHRFRDEYRAAKRWVALGKIGQPRFVVDQLLAAKGPLPGWVWDPNVAGGGMMTYSGVHMIDRALWLVDARVSAVAAATAHLHYDEPLEDTTIATLRFAGGAMATLVQHKTNTDHAETSWETRIFGTTGSIRVKSGASASLLSPDGDENVVVSRERRFREALEELAFCVRNRRRPSPDGPEALKVLTCLHALYRAARNPGWVRP